MVSENDITKQTYENGVEVYIQNTQSVVSGETKEWIDHVLSLIAVDSTILEVGSGAGRDAAYIESMGYSIQRSDGVQSFVQNLEGLHSCLYLDLLHNTHNGKYDLIFANAVFLHFTKNDFKTVLDGLKNNLTDRGILACSFKKGVGCEYSDHKMNAPRYFQYWSEHELSDFFAYDGWKIISLTTTNDDKWIHLVAESNK